MAKYSIIDVDTHLTEAPDLWTSRVPASMKDKVPYVANKGGKLMWVLGDNNTPLATVGHTAVAGFDDGISCPPNNYDEMHPGAANARGRLDYMDQVGIWAMMIYPNVAGFGAQNFLLLKDKELMLTCVQVYNDWLTEWASVDPRRLILNTSLPLWDVEASVKEIRRCHANGHKGILFTGNPSQLGFPAIGDTYWNPLWEVATELDMPISFHVASAGVEFLGDIAKTAVSDSTSYLQSVVAASPKLLLNNAYDMSDLIMSGVLIRYPKLKFVSVESGIGWIPCMLETLDYQFKGSHVAKYHPEFDMLPSDYFRRNFYACYWFEEIAPRRLFDTIGVDNILFETDFPHPLCLYGESVWERIEKGLGDCDESTREKVLFDNAQKLYNIELPTAEDEARLEKVLAAGKKFWTAA